MTSEPTTSVLAQLSDALATAVERAGRSTVTVHARRRIPASGIVWQPGVVLTCDHVLERDEDITITTSYARELPARLVGRDPGSDLAVLRVDATDLIPAEPAPDGSARVGHLVLAIGRPGNGPMASIGVISAVGGPWRTFRGGLVEGYIRTDTTFYPGFSGGPLVDTAGRVVGVNSARLGRGAGLTVPTAAAARIAEQLLRTGRIRRGYLGIGSQPVRLPEPLARLVGQASGLLVVSVEPDSPAARGGLLIGDVIIGMASAPVRDTEDLQALLGPERVGQPTTVTVLRGGERRELTVIVGERQG
jgi:S1-C subfamily serine protease